MTLSNAERQERASIVSERSGGIEPMFEAFYIEALMYSAGRAQAAFLRFDAAVAQRLGSDFIVATAQEALSHVAALSRFFWPARSDALHQARGAKLRAALALDDISPLADRDLRNVLEHFDERLDFFLLEDRVGCFFPGPLVGEACLSGDALGHIFRLVDPATETFVLLGKKYSFGLMRVAVEDLLERLRGMSGGRL